MIINDSSSLERPVNPLKQPDILGEIFKFLDLNDIVASRLTCKDFLAAAPIDNKIITQEIPIIKQILSALNKVSLETLTNEIIGTLAHYDLEFSLIIAEKIQNSLWKTDVFTTLVCNIAPSNPERALEIAERMGDCQQEDKAHVLAAIAYTIAPSNPARALEIAETKIAPLSKEKAEAIATHINDPKEKIKQIALSDHERALEMTKEIEDSDKKNEILAYIAEIIASFNVERALEIAERIQYSSERERVFSNLADKVTFSDPERALKIAEKIQDSYRKDVAIANIAVRFVAKEDLEKALEIVERIKNLGVKTQPLINIAERVATSDPNRAKDMCNEVMNIVKNNSSSWVENFVIDIAVKIAPLDIAKALEIARNLDPFHKALALIQIAKKVISLVKAKALYNEALEIAKTTLSFNRRTEVLTKVAVDIASLDIDKALEIAESVYPHRKEVLAKVAVDIASLDIDKALEIAESIKDYQVKDRTLSSIAERMVFSDVDRAIEIAKSIQDGNVRANALADIAKKMVRPGLDTKRAKNLYYEALGLVKGFQPSELKWFLQNTPRIFLQEPRKIQDIVKDFDPELKIYFLLYTLLNCELESIQTLAMNQFKRISNELRNPSTKRGLIPDPSDDEISKKLRTLATF